MPGLNEIIALKIYFFKSLYTVCQNISPHPDNVFHLFIELCICLSVEGFPCSSVSKESACSVGDRGSIRSLGRSPGERNGNPFQYPCLENLIDRGAWWAAIHGVTKSRAQLSN